MRPTGPSVLAAQTRIFASACGQARVEGKKQCSYISAMSYVKHLKQAILEQALSLLLRVLWGSRVILRDLFAF